MFSIFKKGDSLSKHYKKYRKLMQEHHVLQSVNRKESDQKFMEAQAVLEEIDKIKAKLN